MGPSDEPLEEALYGAYDPQAVAPASTPGESGSAGSDEPGAGADQPEPPVQLPEFDQRYRDEFSGLLYVGALTKTFDWLGHRFILRTLRTGELVQASLAVKDWAGSDGYLKAWQSAIVGAAVVSVDGRPLPPVPLTDQSDDTMVAVRARYVMDHWFPPVLDYLYERYVELELVVRQVIEAMGKATR
jgi:hypothetical protein